MGDPKDSKQPQKVTDIQKLKKKIIIKKLNIGKY